MEVEAQGTGDIIEDVVNAAFPKDTAVEGDTETEDTETETTDEGEGSEDDGGEVDKEMKTIKKALSKKNRYIDNLRVRNRTLEAEIQKLRENKPSVGEAPEMDKFESVLDYMKAQNLHDVKTELTNQANEAKIAALEQQKQVLKQEQDMRMEQDTIELVNASPEAKSILQSSLTVINAMPQHIVDLTYEIDSPVIALYALAKEGRLQDVYHMHPHVAAAELVNAQFRGQQYLAQGSKRPQAQNFVQQVSKAPKPLESSKGSGRSNSTPIDQMSASAIKSWLNT